jgi:hypothetical protein
MESREEDATWKEFVKVISWGSPCVARKTAIPCDTCESDACIPTPRAWLEAQDKWIGSLKGESRARESHETMSTW